MGGIVEVLTVLTLRKDSYHVTTRQSKHLASQNNTKIFLIIYRKPMKGCKSNVEGLLEQ